MATTKHTITPTVLEREDGMAMLRLANGMWAIRAPIAGQARFWDGLYWVVSSRINTASGIWPLRFQFEAVNAAAILEVLEAP